MPRSNWLDALRTALRQGSRRRTARCSCRPVATRRPTFEPLEERTPLAALTVNSALDNNTAGDGLVTLREAIIAANTNATTDLGDTGSGADTIQFDSAVFATPRVIQLSFGDLVITESLTLNGPGQNLLTIDAQRSSRIFDITGSSDDVYTFRELTLTGGMASGNGGAIRAISYDGMLTVEQCTLTGNTATDKGGAIYANLSKVAVTRSLITNNSTTGAIAQGGGLFTRTRGGQQTTISNSVVSHNQTTGVGGGIMAGFGDLLIEDSTVSDNFAGGSGGGFACFGRFGPDNGGSVTLRNSSVTGNVAVSSGGGFFVVHGVVVGSVITGNKANVGGGFEISQNNRNTSQSVLITDTIISGNIATTRGGGFSARYSALLTTSTVSGNTGGGIVVGFFGTPYGNVTLNSSTVSGNSSAEAGGGIHVPFGDVTLNSSTVSGNSSQAKGGGIFARAVELNSSTISGNSAVNNGGGFYSLGPSPITDNTITHSTITENVSESGVGGGFWNGGNVLLITNSIVAANDASVGNPDFYTSASTLTVISSLIGDNAGTTLGESHVSDANGNLIGSAAGSGVIDPHLASLANNGGLTKTHALLARSPALDAIPYYPGPTPAHDYQLNGSLMDFLGGPNLVALGGSLTTLGYNFGPNQGLNLGSAVVNRRDYSIELVFRWNALSGGWQKIIDFHNLTSDVGLYTAGNGLHFLNGAFAPGLFAANTLYHLVLTRDDATDVVRAYINGNEVWNFVDAPGDAVFDGPNQIVRFFQDDSVTGQAQAQSGFVNYIRLYDQVLSSAVISTIYNVPAPNFPDFDQRGAPYARVVDGDGTAGPQADMGAYEAQEVPSFSPGDYNQNGIVDAADYVLWRKTLSANVPSGTGADGDGNGVVESGDYGVWRANFGRTHPGAATSAVVDSVESDPHPNPLPEGAAVSVALSSSLLDSVQLFVSRSSGTRPAWRPPLAVAASHDNALVAWLAATSSGDRRSTLSRAEPAMHESPRVDLEEILVDVADRDLSGQFSHALDRAFESLGV